MNEEQCCEEPVNEEQCCEEPVNEEQCCEEPVNEANKEMVSNFFRPRSECRRVGSQGWFFVRDRSVAGYPPTQHDEHTNSKPNPALLPTPILFHRVAHDKIIEQALEVRGSVWSW